MPRVIIQAPERTLEIDAPEGGSLADLCDQHAAPIEFSCRSANCGTCRIVVVEGMDTLAPPEDDELSVLEIFGDGPDRRLACQAKMKPGLAVLRIRPAPD